MQSITTSLPQPKRFALNTHQTGRTAPFTGMSMAATRVLVAFGNRIPNFPATKDGKALLTTIDRGRTLTDDGYTVTFDGSVAPMEGTPVLMRWQVLRHERVVSSRHGAIRELAHTYTVDIVISDGVVTGDCSPDCTAFARFGHCKHVEAVALRVERMLRENSRKEVFS